MPKVQVKCHHIEGGRMLDMLDASLLRVGREVIQNFQNSGDAAAAKGKVTLSIEVCKHPEYEDEYDVTYGIAESYPKIKGSHSLASGENGVLMANHRGTDRHNPNQESFLEEPKREGED